MSTDVVLEGPLRASRCPFSRGKQLDVHVERALAALFVLRLSKLHHLRLVRIAARAGKSEFERFVFAEACRAQELHGLLYGVILGLLELEVLAILVLGQIPDV